MMSPRVMTCVLVSIASAETTAGTPTAWGWAPWLCVSPVSDPASGEVWTTLDYCSYSASTVFYGKCLERSQGEVSVRDCQEGTAPQQWKPNPDDGRLIVKDPNTNGNMCLTTNGNLGERLTVEPCDETDVFQLWLPLELPPAEKALLVMPELSWCVGLSSGAAWDAQECTAGKVGQSFVRDDPLVHPAAGRRLYPNGTADTLCLDTREWLYPDGAGYGTGMYKCDGGDQQHWTVDESTGALTTVAHPGQCLTCDTLEEQCRMKECAGDATQKFAWSISVEAQTAVSI